MADLKQLMLDCGFTAVQTYIQSGNVVFKAQINKPEEIAATIQLAVANKYGFEVAVLVLASDDFLEMLNQNPFLARKNIDSNMLHLTILRNPPTTNDYSGLERLNYQEDELIFVGRGLYVYTPNGYRNTKLSTNDIERVLKVNATTRNWKTVTRIGEIIKAAG